MKTFLIITLALIATSQAQIINENGANYFVYPSAGGNTMVSGPQGCTYIQPSPIGANVISTGRCIDQGAIVAAQMARPAPMPQTAANPMPNALDQFQSQQAAAWAQANQTMSAALASMPPASPINRQSHPAPTPEKWVMLNSNGQWASVDPPKGLKHTKEGEPLLNPYTHGVEPTEHPPTNPGPWQQYLIDCKVPSNRLMRERTLFAYLDGFGELECFKISIGYDENNLKKYHTQFMQLISTLNPDQKTQLRTHLCEDFGVKDPKYIQTKELIPYFRLWIRDHPQNVASNVAAHP